MSTLRIDALFNMLGVLITFIVVLLSQINPPTDPQITPPGNLVASAAWPAGAIDVDLWVSAPGDSPVGYVNKSGKVFSLLRDDLGTSNDSTPLNYESAFTRGLPDGEYIINVKCFGCAGNVPVNVDVEVRLVEGGVVWTGVVTLVAEKQERTAIRFRLRGGKVVAGSASSVFKPLSNGGV
ncbi:hypothetical protein KNLIENLN_00086 [Sinorhizobium phage NV1.1.1]|nr:hypothetical protein KNLIENLN_00086 [Sinorhizobium phage NV1.1.1]